MNLDEFLAAVERGAHKEWPPFWREFTDDAVVEIKSLKEKLARTERALQKCREQRNTQYDMRRLSGDLTLDHAARYVDVDEAEIQSILDATK